MNNETQIYKQKSNFGDYMKQNYIWVSMTVIILLLGYGFLLCNPSIGTDDTAYDMYFDFGYSMRMGRILLPIVHKVFDIVQFTPFWMELIAVLFLFIAAWKIIYILNITCEISFSKIFMFSFVSIFISYPLINEIFIYSYMSLSIGCGYLLAALAFESFIKLRKEFNLNYFLKSIVLLTAGISLYESFVSVFFCLVMIQAFLQQIYFNVTWKKFVRESIIAVGIGGGSVLLNKVLTKICIAIFQLSNLRAPSNTTIVWSSGDIAKGVKSVFKTIFYDQIIAGVEYLPVLIYALAVSILFAIACYYFYIKRDGIILLCFAGMYITAEVIVLLQGQTYYRNCQSFALVSALAFGIVLEKIYHKKQYKLTAIIIVVVLLLQTQDLSHWFYLNNQRSEVESNLITQLVVDMKKDGLMGKKIAFVYDMQKTVEFDYYGSYNSISSQSYVRKIVNYIVQKNSYTNTPEFLYQLNRKHNQTNCLTTYLQYGVNAFEDGIKGPNYELKKMLNSYFFDFEQVSLEEFEKAKELAETMPSYPSDKYYMLADDFVVVKVGI